MDKVGLGWDRRWSSYKYWCDRLYQQFGQLSIISFAICHKKKHPQPICSLEARVKTHKFLRLTSYWAPTRRLLRVDNDRWWHWNISRFIKAKSPKMIHRPRSNHYIYTVTRELCRHNVSKERIRQKRERKPGHAMLTVSRTSYVIFWCVMKRSWVWKSVKQWWRPKNIKISMLLWHWLIFRGSNYNRHNHLVESIVIVWE